MANSLQTKIALLYRTYESWQTEEWANYIPLKGEVCFCPIPAASHVFASEPCLMFKVGQGVMDGSGTITGPKFSELDWCSAKAADVYAWAKKENLDFNDLDETFKANLLAYIEEHIETTDTQYRLNNDEDEHIWKLQKSTDKGVTWIDTGTAVNIKAVVTRMNDLETRVTTVETDMTSVKNWINNDGFMTESEIKKICPVE